MKKYLEKDSLIFILVIICFTLLTHYKILENGLDAIAILIASYFALIQWHKEKENERKTREKEIRIGYYYSQIAMGAQRDPENEKNFDVQRKLEEAVAIIQLYGTEEEIEMIHNAIINESPLDQLLKSLRKRLREEIGLGKKDKEILPLRSAKEEAKIKEYQKKKR